MITRVEIPRLTLTMDGGTLVKWLKQEGDLVERDESLFELETDKTVVEMPSPSRGMLRKILVRDGAVAVGATVAFIGDASDQLPDVDVAEGVAPPGIQVSGVGTRPPKPEEAGGVRATPAARRRACELSLSLSGLVGTGPDGRITQEDVERLASRSDNK
jgi:pyruvate dehydrogenase E2 component (dihydrolipoamide acetyltransferase)